MNRFALAFRSFFDIQLHGRLSDDVRSALDEREEAETPAVAAPSTPAAAAPHAQTSAAPLQILAILQRDGRLVDFLMEDLSGYADDQVGAAVRELHDQCHESLSRHVHLEPVIDAVEGAYTRVPDDDPGRVKFVGNVPAKPPDGGILRHRGWRAAKVDLPAPTAQQDTTILAPAEIEVE